jgi:hypothetical protein
MTGPARTPAGQRPPTGVPALPTRGPGARALVALLERAREQARALVDALERRGHGEIGPSSGLYLGLVALRKRVSVELPATSIAPELEQLVRQCEGELAPVRPALEQALRLARR